MGIPSRLPPTHWLLATTTTQYVFTPPLLISWQNSILFVLAIYLHLWVQMDNDWTTYHLPLWHASNGPSHVLPFLDKIPSRQGIFPKEVMDLRLETNYRSLFLLPPNHTLWIPLTVDPPPLYWIGTSWWCFDPCVLAPLFYIFVLFRSHAVSAVTE